MKLCSCCVSSASYSYWVGTYGHTIRGRSSQEFGGHPVISFFNLFAFAHCCVLLDDTKQKCCGGEHYIQKNMPTCQTCWGTNHNFRDGGSMTPGTLQHPPLHTIAAARHRSDEPFGKLLAKKVIQLRQKQNLDTTKEMAA